MDEIHDLQSRGIDTLVACNHFFHCSVCAKHKSDPVNDRGFFDRLGQQSRPRFGLAQQFNVAQ
jgi:hypothetical protein